MIGSFARSARGYRQPIFPLPLCRFTPPVKLDLRRRNGALSPTGERLIMSVSGLGPVKPNLDPGKPFVKYWLHNGLTKIKTKVSGGQLADEKMSRSLGNVIPARELIDRYGPTMLRVAQMYVRDRATAEEVVQETWLAVLNGIDRFEQRSSLKTWLFRILTNRAKTRGKRDGRMIPFSSRSAPGPSSPCRA